ncbi:MAG: HpcH/HpaI aldolase/citrate lyase family protein [Halobacteriota archaeon]
MQRRSVLFSPGDRPELLRKAAATDADVIVFDLEDAVAPTEKATARAAVADVVTDPSFDPDAEVCVRLSGLDLEADLEAICAADSRVDAVMRSKVKSEDDVRQLSNALFDRDVDLAIYALIETAAGVLSAGQIAAADGTDALVFGAEDLAADIGASRTSEGTEVLYAREHVVLAASAAGVDAIDTVFTDFEDSDGLESETAFAATLGYDGKLAIHPAQVDVINDGFTPDRDRIAWAERVLEAKTVADGEGRGVFEVDGQMIDAPLVAQAERILERAGRRP